MTKVYDAKQDVRGYIDDRQQNADGTFGRRWSDAQVLRCLESAASHCVDVFTSKGGDDFVEEVEVSTVAATAQASLLAYDPLRIIAVLIKGDSSGDGFTFPCNQADPAMRGAKDLTSRDLLVRLVRRPKIGTDDADELLGVTDGAMRSWPAFDRWVCMVAGLELGITDRDARADLIAAEERMRSAILTRVRIPSKLPWPRARSRWLWDLRWMWIPRTGALQMQLAGARGW